MQVNDNNFKACYRHVKFVFSHRYNIVIIGRMFHQLSAAKRLYFADIIIDERNSIVLCSPSQLQEDMLEPFIFRLFSLSIKFSFCYIIITQTTANANCDQM